MTIVLTKCLRSSHLSSSIHYRQFWNSLNVLSNKYDRKRVEELGPDRACAEWLLRCGGSIRYKNWGSFITNQKQIPTGTPGQFKIEEIRAIKSSITSEGFAYLSGLTDLKKIHLEKCDQIDDSMSLIFISIFLPFNQLRFSCSM